MTVQQFLRATFSIALLSALQAGPSPKGPQSGMLGQIGVVQPSNEQSALSPDFGRALHLPPVAAEAVLPFQRSNDGTRFTLLRFGASGSAGVRLHFRNMHLSSAAHVFVYGQGRDGAAESVFGPYDGAGPVRTGEFWTPAIHGESAIVELQVGDDVPSDLPFEVDGIASLNERELAAAPGTPANPDTTVSREIRRSMYKGKVVEHEVRDGMAIFEDDIILGPANRLQPAEVSKGLGDTWRTSTATTWSSSRWPNGVIPYVIDPAMTSPSRVTDAIAYWNTTMNGVVKLVPRTNQTNYVYFAYTTNASYCASSVGMAGGMQTTYLGDYCVTGNVIHEIGHDFGLWHEHTRNDRNTYVTIELANITSSSIGNFTQTGLNGMDIGSYDYNSVMHYPAYAFSANGLPTIDTIPAGIPIGQRNGLSTGDIAGIAQIYGGSVAPTTFTESINSNPNGGVVTLDGAALVLPYSVQWTAGAAHTVSASNPAPSGGQKLTFSTWSDGGAQTHTVTASTSSSVLTANYAVSFLVTTQVSPAGSGTVTVSPASSDNYYGANSNLSLTATPASGYCFSSWTGLLSETPNQTTLVVTKAYSLVANFVSCGTTTTTTSFNPIRVNAGGASYVDANGNTWSADTGFTGGSMYSTNTTLGGTNTQALYQSEHWSSGTLQYVFNVPNGNYTVNLKFAEIYFSTAGNRVFNIVINGQTVASNFDPGAAGINIANDRSFPVSVTSGKINIQLVSVISNPKVSAIEIVSAGSPITPPTTVVAPPPPPPSSAFTPIRVHSGGSKLTDSLGQVWSADTGYIGGNTYGIGATVAGTPTPALYQTERWFYPTVHYQFAVPNGATYTVTLKFAEIYFTTAGNRIFNIVINGQTVLSNFDPCAAAGGPNTAVDRQFSVTPTNGQIDIQLVSVVSNPKVSAIEIR